MKKLFTIKLVFLYIFLTGFIFSCTELFSNGNSTDDLRSLDQKVETLLSKMTLRGENRTNESIQWFLGLYRASSKRRTC